MTKNDAKILELRNKIEKKKKELGSARRFAPITNCSLELDGCRYNLHTLDRETAIALLVKISAYCHSAESLGYLEEYKVAGYLMLDWQHDVRAKLENLSVQAENRRLKALETQLEKLLSDDKKTELAIDEIANSL